MRIIIISIVLIVANIFKISAQNEIEIKGLLVSKENNEVIPFASILDITSYKHGTTSQEDGTFFLKIPVNKQESNYQIKIACLGFNDTIININSFANNSIIKLSPHVYELLEVVVVARNKSKISYIGLPEGALLINDKGKKQGLPANTSAGSSSGVFVKSKNNQKGLLKSISIYLLEKGFPETPFSVRILVSPKDKIKHNRMYSTNAFVDYLKESVIFKGTAGWNIIELEDYNIPLPENDYLILFTPLDYGKKYKWHNEYGEYYGMVIGVYNKKKIPQLFWAFKSQDFYSYDDSPNQLNFTPAIVINYYNK